MTERSWGSMTTPSKRVPIVLYTRPAASGRSRNSSDTSRFTMRPSRGDAGREDAIGDPAEEVLHADVPGRHHGRREVDDDEDEQAEETDAEAPEHVEEPSHCSVLLIGRKRAEQDHGRRHRLQDHAGAQRRPVGAGPIAQDTDERGPERERELVDSDRETDERAEALAGPLDGEDEAGERRQVADAEAEERAA